MKKSLLNIFTLIFLLLAFGWQTGYGQTYHDLSTGSFTQDWTNTGLITASDNWTGVPSILGFLGDGDSGSPTGVDPQTFLAPLTNLDVIANLSVVTSTAGGVGEFQITDPVVGLQGSGTADYPSLIIYLNATGRTDIRVQYDLRDIDATSDNTNQQVALQYRIGATGNFVNIPAGYVADASTGPSIATLVTHIDVTLPTECNGQNQIQVRILTSNAPSSDEWIGVDNIVVSSTADLTAPVPTFNPPNNATDILVWTKPTITFNEPIRKTDGNSLENIDLTSIVSFKKTNSGGADVPYTAVIDAAKKVITITPSSTLDNSQVYYLAVGAIEDASGNESTGTGITFTTISASTPVVTLTNPVGGETFYAGDNININWYSASITNVKIEAWTVSSARTWSWSEIVASTPASAGTLAFIILSDAIYGTQYKLRISDATNSAVYSESGNFTCITVATSLSDLKARCIIDDIVKIGSEVILTFKTGTKDYYIQDAGAGILLYDSYLKITTAYNQYDGITGLTGVVATYNDILEIIPNADPGAPSSTGNSVTPIILTAAALNTNYETYESMLVKLKDMTFADAGSSFVINTAYSISDASGATAFFTKFSSVDYLGTTIPAGTCNVTGLCVPSGTTARVAARNLLDFTITTGMEEYSSTNKINMYPVPASSVLNVHSVPNLKSIEILDVTGKVIKTINTGTDELIQVPVTSLRRGMYLIRFNTTEGKVVKRFVKS